MAEGEYSAQRQCNICEESGLRRNAEKFCSTCKQSLCNDCLALHKIMTTTMQHEITSIDELPTDAVDERTKKEEDTSDTSCQVTCDVCKERGEFNSAPFICLQCEEYLCESCRQYHMILKATRQHEIKEKPEPVLESGSSETAKCKEHDCAYEFFCKKHMAVLCPECKTTGHGGCGTVSSIEEAAKHFYTISNCKDMIQTLASLMKDVKAYKEMAKAESRILRIEQEAFMDKLRQIRTKFDAMLGKLEAKATEELNGAIELKRKKITDQVREKETLLDGMNQYTSKLQNAMSKHSDEERLIAVSLLQHDKTNQWQSETKDTYDKETQEKYISNLKECMEFLHKLSQVEIKVSVYFSEGQTTIKSKLIITSDRDEESPEILSYAELENEKTTISDMLKDITEYAIAVHSMKL